MATMSVRGTITSWTFLSPSAKTEWIMSRSSMSSTPCSSPVSMSALMSSSLMRVPSCGLAPNGAVTTRVRKKSTATSGRVSHVMSSSGNTMRRSTCFAWRAPIERGTNSPNRTATSESAATVTTTAPRSLKTAAMPTSRSSSERRGLMNAAATPEKAKITKNSTTWIAAR